MSQGNLVIGASAIIYFVMLWITSGGPDYPGSARSFKERWAWLAGLICGALLAFIFLTLVGVRW